MSKAQHRPTPGRFGWNELVTTNVAGAKKFYTGLLGWKTKPFGQGMEYTLFTQGKDGIGGLMKCPKPGNPPTWLPYIFVKDVDATVKKAKKMRGKVCMPPFDIPTVGRTRYYRTHKERRSASSSLRCKLLRLFGGVSQALTAVDESLFFGLFPRSG